MQRLLLPLLLLLGGCTLGPRSPEQGPAPLPVSYSETTGSINQATNMRWWSAYRDPTLDRVIAAGLANNLDIKSALARIDAAQANITVAGAGGLPSINFDASFLRSRETGDMKEVAGVVDTSAYGASANWLIDIFGEVRSQIRSAQASRNAAVEGAAIARLALLSDMATAYVDARYYQEMMSIGSRTVASRERALALTTSMASKGSASGLDVSRSADAVDAIRGELPGYEAAFRRSVHRVSTLAGQPAATMLPLFAERSGQPIPAFKPDAGIPADLVRNRPDIRKAEQEFVASLADIGYARTQLLPTITLSGSITSSFIRTDAKSGDLNKWSFGPSIRIPIFEGGKLRANVKIAVATAEQKQLAWRGAVLKAVEDVENALVAYNRDTKALSALSARVGSASRTVALSEAAFRAGTSSRFEIIDAERQLFDAQTRLAQARRSLALDFIALNIAVGRGLPGPGSDAAVDRVETASIVTNEVKPGNKVNTEAEPKTSRK